MLRRLLWMSTGLLVVMMGAVLCSSAHVEAAPRQAAVSAASMAMAKKMYGYDCAMCHGANGDGKGDVAVSTKMELKDWTSPDALKGMSDDDLYTIIAKGKGTMPGEDGRTSAEVMRGMVVLVRSYAAKSGG